MPHSILVTGASGFLGSRLLEPLAATGSRIVCLGRRKPSAQVGNIEFVGGNFLDREACRQGLKGCDTVLHLAAVTGKHRPEEYFQVNRDGVAVLLEQARAAGAGRFLYVSTIAAKFENRFRYHYAESKREAEGLVRNSGLNWTIVRPTMIFGPGSPVQEGLRRLAALPVMPVFGNGRVLVQPIFVDDAAKILVEILQGETLGGRTVEIGGPEVLPMEELLLRMRRAAGVRNNRLIHLPVGAMAACLAAVEPVLRPLLPLTAGQLASFLNSGEAATDAPGGRQGREMRGVDEMLG